MQVISGITVAITLEDYAKNFTIQECEWQSSYFEDKLGNKIDNLTSRTELLIIGVNNHYLSINQVEELKWLLENILRSRSLHIMFPNDR